jgi:Transposase IS200 like
MPRGLKRFHHSRQTHFVTFCCYHRQRRFATDESRRVFESALERVRRSFRLYIYGYVVMPEHVHLLLSEPQPERGSTKADVGQANGAPLKADGGPLKPAFGLSGNPDWLSNPQHYASPCVKVSEARGRATLDRRCCAFLAKTLLRFQRSRLPAIRREAPLHPSQPSEARTMRSPGRLAVEQLSPLLDRF